MSRKRGQQAAHPDPARENFEAGCAIITYHPLFGPLWQYAYIERHAGNRCPNDGWAVIAATQAMAVIHTHPTRYGEPEEWAYVLAHCLLHLGFGHFQRRERPQEWNDACCWFLSGFQRQLKIGRPPIEMAASDAPAATEERIYDDLCARGLPPGWLGCGAAGAHGRDMLIEKPVSSEQTAKARSNRKPPDWGALFAQGLTAAVSRAVEVAAGEIPSLTSAARSRSAGRRAREWFINSYPLLGALAAAFTIIEDPLVCQRMNISIAAVDMESREIYINPASGLLRTENTQQLRFVMAHELLHVGLRHDARQQGRDPYLWNVAADFIINAWLVEMGVGVMPEYGLFDPALAGESAESVYDRIVTDLRRYRKLTTMRGVGVSDILQPGQRDWPQGVADLDTWYRNALSQGLSYHQDSGRGLLPAGLIEEIEALSQPPIPWDVELARWFDNFFQPVEFVRSYSRPSRRQSSTPDIPRPRWVPPPDWQEGRTFGVVLDTSGSMDRKLLAKALGAIASYSLSRDVPAVRVIFCDAATYDQGYMRPEDIAARVRVRGRGGTILQPALDLLQAAQDFPADGPVLIITDARCDKLTVPRGRDHAYLLPMGANLPFPPRGPVFRMRL
ncbi:MAG TPA: VWA-like domain-containing protein [Ktedonobacterales bacterium]|nr:VWA-like domain-containing protein [Ktedonobacterales bacterium]